jgi:ATP-dependent DNA helicase DinG
MRRLTMTVDEFFASGGPLSAVYGEKYEPRHSQVLMAQAVYDHVKDGKHLIVEAPTGVGKSMAYTVGSLLAGRPLVIVTANHGLQRQLMEVDLPLLRKAVESCGDTLSFSLIMGKSNYFCRQRAADITSGVHLDLLNWGLGTGPGADRDTGLTYEFETKVRPLDAGEWGNVCADDSCSRWHCDQSAFCGYMGAVRAVGASDVVVMNQHLLAVEVSYGMIGGIAIPAGFGGSAGAVVVLDEAHEWPDILANANSVEMHIGRFRPYENEGWYRKVVDYFDRAYAYWMQSAIAKETNIQTVIEDGFPEDISDNLYEWAFRVWPSAGTPVTPGEYSLKSKAERARSLARDLRVMASPSIEGVVRLFEKNGRTWANRKSSTYLEHVLFRYQVVDVSKVSRQYIDKCNGAGPHMTGEDDVQRVNIFTSATLRSGGSFEFFLDETGLEKTDTLVLPAVFDYRKNGLLYVPRDLPEDVHSDIYFEAVAKRCWELAQITEGRMFVLITSYAKLRVIADFISNWIAREADPLEWLVLRQDEDSSMVDQFKEREGKKTILLGTATYWQGVDVPGEALVQVVIVNLPFAPHTDPVFQAKAKIVERKYGERASFMRLSIPIMGRKLRQGAGRLHRRSSDRGVISILDARAVTARWGTKALLDVPDMPRTGSLQQVRVFFGHPAKAEDLI